MERNAYKQLLEWKNNPRHKPLILNGARQVGKTWLLKYFGEKERFLDLDKLFSSKIKEIDCLVVNTRKENKYCINVCHFGLDSYVAETANEVKKKGGKKKSSTKKK